MARLFTTSAVLVLVALCGCQPSTEKTTPPPAVVNSAVAGKWMVTAINDKPVASGTEINVTYHADGKVTVETTGDAAEAPKVDKEALKLELDQVSAPRGRLLDTFTVTAGTTKLALKWNGGEREVPKAPVPPK